MTLSTLRIHGLIPLSDLSLTQLYRACLLRTDSLCLFYSMFKPFILSPLYEPVFLNDFPVIVSIPLFVSVSVSVCSVMVSLQ